MVGRASGELGRAGVDRLVNGAQPVRVADLADRVLANAPQGGDLDVGEAVALGPDQEVSGQGIGAELLEKFVVRMRDENKKAVLTCPFAVKWFDEHPENGDLVAE